MDPQHPPLLRAALLRKLLLLLSVHGRASHPLDTAGNFGSLCGLLLSGDRSDVPPDVRSCGGEHAARATHALHGGGECACVEEGADRPMVKVVEGG